VQIRKYCETAKECIVLSKNTKFALIINLLILSSALWAQNQYSTKRVEYLFEKIFRNGINELSGDTLNIKNDTSTVTLYKKVFKKRKTVIRVEKKMEIINHVGMYLFNQNEIDVYNPISRFLEQKILEYIIDGDQGLVSRMAVDNLYFLLNNIAFGSLGFESFDAIIPLLQKRDYLKIKKSKFNYRILWKIDHQDSLEVRFPARQDLIVGKDKIELDEELIQKLLSKQWSHKSSEYGPPYYHSWQHSLYVKKGIEYFPGINSSTFYKLKSNTYAPLFEKKYPKESVNNLLIDDLVEADSFWVRIDHNLYGGKIQNYTVSIKQLTSFFKQDHDVFVGFEAVNADSITATVLFVNRFFNHLHILKIELPTRFIGARYKVFISGKLYTTIRFDNVKDLFGKYLDKEKLLKIQFDH
jgi:hypothetical protein